MDGQTRLTDLVPKKIGSLVLLFLGGVTLVAGLEALYAWMPDLASHTTDGRVAAFDLDGEGSLAVWFSSATLSLAGLTALVVYSVRKRRQDDYHGRYRIWLWAALCWFTLSIDETASLHEGFKELMAWLTGRRLLGDGSIWWVIAYAPILGLVGLRLLLDMREYKGSIVLLFATAAAYATAVAAQLDWVLPQGGARSVMLEEGCEMVGDLFLLFAMAAHARYVILDSRGEWGARQAKAKKASRKEAEKQAALASPGAAAGNSQKPADVPGAKGSLAKPGTPVSQPVRSANVRIDPPSDGPLRHRMSKAERKALRRQQQSDQDDY